MEAIQQACEEAGIYLIEDCAHALGCTWRVSENDQEVQVGHFGRIACFSSQSYKMLNSGEGGIIPTDDNRAQAGRAKLQFANEQPYCFCDSASAQNT